MPNFISALQRTGKSMCMYAKSLQSCLTLRIWLFVTLWTVARQAPHGYSPGENGLPCLPPGDLLHLGMEPLSPKSPAVQADSLLLNHWEALEKYTVQFSHSVMSVSLRPHGLQHTRLPCPSPTPGACSNSCPPRWWCHPTISSSVVPFSSAFNLSQHQGLFQWVSSLH